MITLAPLFSPSGRLAPRPFVWGALAVYIASFLTQFLLSAPITARAHVVPFVAAQVVLGWIWYALHVRRLRDSGRGPGAAMAVTILYAMAIVLLLLVVLSAHNMSTPESGGMAAVSIMTIFLMFFLASLVIGADAAGGMFGYVFLGALVLVTLPVLVGGVFTVWLANRASAPPAS